MALSEGTKNIVKSFSGVFDVLQNGLDSREKMTAFLNDFGWRVPMTRAEISTVNAVFVLKNTLEQIAELANSLEEDDADVFDLLEQLVPIMKSVYQDVKNISSVPGIQAGMPYPFSESDFWEQMKQDLPNYIIHRYVEESHPKWYSLLYFLGILDVVHVYTEDRLGGETGLNISDQSDRINFYRREVRWDRLTQLITDPAGLFKGTYGWDVADTFDHYRFIDAISLILDSAGFASKIIRPPQDLLDEYIPFDSDALKFIRAIEIPIVNIPNEDWNATARLGLLIMPIPRHFEDMHHANLPGGFMITPLVQGSFTGLIPFSSEGDISVGFFGDMEANGLFRFNITPEGVTVHVDAGQITLDGGVFIEAKPQKPYKIIGDAEEGGFYIHLEGAYAGAFVSGPVTDPEFTLTVGTSKDDNPGQPTLVFGINFADGDSFISKIFEGKHQEIKIGGRLIWSSKDGFSIDGNIGFKIHLKSHLNIGPLSFTDMDLELGTSGDNAGLIFGTDVNLKLGPFKASVEEIGLAVEMTNKEGTGEVGIFGDLDFDFGFKPPTGIGFVIDASAFKGGGFLSFDFEEERYVGALELSVKDKIALKVIGVLTTKLPGNEDGYSLLLLITAEFEPINLGFGFTLNGVGGLIALNRTMNFEYLRAGVKAKTLDNILFPTDPIANINQIISDLEGAFPVSEGRYAFGPMAIIGWGTPTLITIELGLMIEVPSPVRLAILGVVKAILPSPDKQLLKLQINFLGTIDFEAKFMTFDASIYDSKLLSFTLAGDMVFRLKWGENSNFLFSLGGFHPSYTPPPLGIPSMSRLTINLLGGDNPRLTLTSYFALTSNTVQFGSAIDFYYRITSKWDVVGYMGFDILIQFNPFYLTAQIGASLAVRKNGETKLGIYLGASVSGPAPWHVQGTAEFEVCKITLKVSFDKTFGESQTTTLPNIAVKPLLVDALSNKANWQASIPENNNLFVTLRELDNAPGNVVAHPFGSIGVSQKIVPLGTAFNKFGTQRPSDHTKFEIKIANDATVPVDFETNTLKDLFAPAEFFAMSDSAKLTRKSFEEFNSGVTIKGNDTIKSTFLMERELMYEQVVMDSRNTPVNDGLKPEKPIAFNAFIQNGSAAKSKPGSKSKPVSANAPAKVGVKEEKFTIANVSDLSLYNSTQPMSEAEMHSLLDDLFKNNPELTGELQVVPVYELA
jgi:hypothetical protein